LQTEPLDEKEQWYTIRLFGMNSLKEGAMNVTCISVAREQLGKHIPVRKNSWLIIGKRAFHC
jgi:hypothetical protein